MLRFAPSPTGDMHIGNLRVAIFNYIVAKQRGEKFIVRIEDTDKERNIEGKDLEILEALALFGITYDQLFYQSKNLHIHRNMALKLLHEKRAFACYCTPEELEIEREKAKSLGVAYRYSGKCEFLSEEEVFDSKKPFVIRLKKPDHPISFYDRLKGKLTFDPKDIDAFVILRADGSPTYNFACAVDDMLHGISFVIRGEDHVSNTPKQIHIRTQLGYEKEIEYMHLPIILSDEGKKMSKRDQASSVKWLLEQGFLPEAIANHLILLGNKTPTEIFTIQEAIEWFDIGSISRSPACFDLDKLRFINREHIRRMDPLVLSKQLGYADRELGMLALVYLEEASTLVQLKEKLQTILGKKVPSAEIAAEVETLRRIIKEAPFFESFDELKHYLIEKSGLKGKNFFKPLRFLLTGAEHGPDLGAIYPYIRNYLLEVVR